MIGRLCALGAQILETLGHAFDERGHAFNDYEAGDFLAAGGRMESDGPDAADRLNVRDCTCGSFDPLTDLHAPYCPLSGPGAHPHVRYWDKDFNEVPDPFSAAGVAAETPSAPGAPTRQVAADRPAPADRAGNAGAGHTNSVSAASSTPDTRGPGAGSTDRPLSEVFTDIYCVMTGLAEGIGNPGWRAVADYARDVLIPEARDLAAQFEALDTQ